MGGAERAVVTDDRRALYGAAQVRELDRRAIAQLGIAGYALMQRAAAACWRELRQRRPQARRLDIVCGPGNNGGDGYEIARCAQQHSLDVRVWTLGAPREGSEAAEARDAWARLGGSRPYAEGALDGAELIVDAIYGTGVSRAIEGDAAAAIGAINSRRAAGAFVVAVDVPSGLDSDSGRVHGIAVQADLSVSFIGRKLGLYTGAGPAHAGERVFDALGLPPDLTLPPLARLLDAEDLRVALPPRPRDAHKGRHGHVLLIGGDHGYAGAVLLAARAALRSGAGLVSVATRDTHAVALAAAQPEAMFRGVESADALAPLIERADIVAIGPGLARNDWSRAMWQAVRTLKRPLVVDADALNLLAEETPATPREWVLTPHPGEAARLLGIAVKDVEADRPSAAVALRRRYGGAAVLKGAGSLVCGERGLAVCPYGNPGMATGGSGDVLTGVIVALLGQGLETEQAARVGVLAHALAGDCAARQGERGLLPSDLIEALRQVLNP